MVSAFMATGHLEEALNKLNLAMDNIRDQTISTGIIAQAICDTVQLAKTLNRDPDPEKNLAPFLVALHDVTAKKLEGHNELRIRTQTAIRFVADKAYGSSAPSAYMLKPVGERSHLAFSKPIPGAAQAVLERLSTIAPSATKEAEKLIAESDREVRQRARTEIMRAVELSHADNKFPKPR